MKQIGSTFPAELAAAGLAGLPFSWTAAGEIAFDDSVTQQQRDAVMAVYAAHDPKQAEIQSKWEFIKAERDRRTDQGGYKVGTLWFHSDQKSRSQQLGLNLLAIQVLASGGTASTPLPGVTPWKTMDGSEVTMTAGLAQQILAAAAASDSAIFDAAKAHKLAMESSPDPASYDVLSDWPKSFGEA